eukprot:scaffold37948_cov191-Amphora_coffeaeformis.AAC.1
MRLPLEPRDRAVESIFTVASSGIGSTIDTAAGAAPGNELAAADNAAAAGGPGNVLPAAADNAAVAGAVESLKNFTRETFREHLGQGENGGSVQNWEPLLAFGNAHNGAAPARIDFSSEDANSQTKRRPFSTVAEVPVPGRVWYHRYPFPTRGRAFRSAHEFVRGCAMVSFVPVSGLVVGYPTLPQYSYVCGWFETASR